MERHLIDHRDEHSAVFFLDNAFALFGKFDELNDAGTPLGLPCVLNGRAEIETIVRAPCALGDRSAEQFLELAVRNTRRIAEIISRELFSRILPDIVFLMIEPNVAAQSDVTARGAYADRVSAGLNAPLMRAHTVI